MAIKDLITKNWSRGGVPAAGAYEDPFIQLQREMNRVFDHFSRGLWDGQPFGLSPLAMEKWGDFVPRTDLSEDDKALHLSLELPGMDEKDVQISLSGDQLTIRGEKRTEHKESDKQFHRVERSYGSFQRTVPLPVDVDAARAEAVFKKGVLSIHLPKRAGIAAGEKKIAVKRA